MDVREHEDLVARYSAHSRTWAFRVKPRWCWASPRTHCCRPCAMSARPAGRGSHGRTASRSCCWAACRRMSSRTRVQLLVVKRETSPGRSEGATRRNHETGHDRLAGGAGCGETAASDARRTLHIPWRPWRCARGLRRARRGSPRGRSGGWSERGTVPWQRQRALDRGTSTLHPWSSRTIRHASCSASPRTHDRDGRTRALVRVQGVRGVVVDVPVRALHSQGAKLDKNLWKAMRANEFPNVHFELTSYGLGPLTSRRHARHPCPGDPGDLWPGAAGRTGRSPAGRAGGLWLVGSTELQMSDYGIRHRP